MNQPYYVKYHQGLFAEAQQQGKLTVLLAYYKLKTLNREGVIKRPKSTGLLMKVLNLKQAQVYWTLQQLTKLGWIRTTPGEYQLISLDQVILSLGLNPLLSHKRWKIKSEQRDHFFELFGLTEISYNLYLQEKQVDHNIKVLSHSQPDTAIIPRSVFIHSKQVEQRHRIRAGLTSFFNDNWLLTLTAHKVALLLGYNSDKTAWNYLKNLEKLNFIKYTKSKSVFIQGNVQPQVFRTLNLDGSFLLTKRGCIFKIMPNEITIL